MAARPLSDLDAGCSAVSQEEEERRELDVESAGAPEGGDARGSLKGAVLWVMHTMLI